MVHYKMSIVYRKPHCVLLQIQNVFFNCNYLQCFWNRFHGMVRYVLLMHGMMLRCILKLSFYKETNLRLVLLDEQGMAHHKKDIFKDFFLWNPRPSSFVITFLKLIFYKDVYKHFVRAIKRICAFHASLTLSDI